MAAAQGAHHVIISFSKCHRLANEGLVSLTPAPRARCYPLL